MEDGVELRRVPGVGPEDADGMIVGEAPGANENRAGRPFVGKAGAVLNAYLLAAGIPRPDLFVTNLYPFWPGPGNPDPTAAQIASEDKWLVRDIERVRPRVIGAVGRLAARWFLGDVDIGTVHGIPLWSDKAPGAIIVPITHPAAGFYRPEAAKDSQDDIIRLRYYLDNDPRRLTPPEIKVQERGLTWRYGYNGGSIDTEGVKGKPWGWSHSLDGKTAEVGIYKDGARFSLLKGRIGFHHALHDLPILREMGVDTTGLDYDDTMVMAFVLQLEPQSLKALSFRHLGLKMMEFEEMVRPWFDRKALAWLRAASEKPYPKGKEVVVEDYGQKRWRVSRPWDAGRRIKAVLKAWEKTEEKKLLDRDQDDLKLEKRWGLLPEEHHAQAEHAMGRDFPDFSIFCVPKKQAVPYSGTDAAVTEAVRPILKRMLQERGLLEVYEMDRRALPFVDRMQEVGMRVEVPLLCRLEDDLGEIRKKARKNVQRIVGDRWFNPGSGDQVAHWLYDVRGVEPLRETESGRGSTSDESLQMIRGYHGGDEELVEFVTGVQDYREADKYLGTFIAPMFLYMRRDRDGHWRVHPNFRATRVVSGRLSSYDPNVLAFPTRTELGKRIRLCFVAGPGNVLLSADMSQIELRLGAHFSQDPVMRKAFERGADLHALTASIIFKVGLTQVTETQRYVAKTINFAVFYGISPQALLEQLYKASIFDYTFEHCETFISEWFKLYSSVRTFQRKLWRKAETDGFVKTLYGRICYVPNLRLTDTKLRDAARRLAGNFPVQGSAADLVKRAETRVMDFIESHGLRDVVRPWLQMHDELDIEIVSAGGMVEEMKAMVMTAMLADQVRVSVPLKVKVGVGDSWGSAK